MNLWSTLTKVRTLYILVLFVAIYITLLIQFQMYNITFSHITYELDSYRRNVSSKQGKSLPFMIDHWKKHMQNKRKSLSAHDKYFGSSRRKRKKLEPKFVIQKIDSHQEPIPPLLSPGDKRNWLNEKNSYFVNNKNSRSAEDEDKRKREYTHNEGNIDYDINKEISNLQKYINSIRNKIAASHAEIESDASNRTRFAKDFNIKKQTNGKSQKSYKDEYEETPPFDGMNSYESSDTNEDVWSQLTWKDIINGRLEYSINIDEFEIENIKPGEKLILLFTTLWNDDVWADMYADRVNDIAKEYQCPVQNCVFTYNKRFFNRSDAVVFHIPDLKDPHYASMLSKYGGRSSDQKWVYFNSETINSINTNVYEDGLFNLTLTYDSRSDIPIPYGRYRRLRANETPPPEKLNYAKNRKNGAVWFVSNCDMRLRIWLAKELEKYITVSVGGLCEDGFEKKEQCEKLDGQSNIQECQSTIKQYKYYFSFESRFCRDYITEKYWDNAIANDVVPIVLGGANYSDPKLAIPGSYINAQDFESVQKLGEYLQKLNGNDKLYNQYLKWKQKYKRVERDHWPYTKEWICELCASLNQKTERKSYNFTSEWNKEKLCDGDRDKVVKNWYLQHWRAFQIANNISDTEIPIDDHGNKRWEVLEDFYNTQKIPDENDENDENDESLSEDDYYNGKYFKR